MSVANPRLSAPQLYGRIVVVGGGCYGGYYVRQLQRAVAAGAIVCERVVVVDRDPECAIVADDALHDPLIQLVIADWRTYFAQTLGAAALAGESHDAIVPSPLMPHLLRDWLVDAARERWPQRVVQTEPLPVAPNVPWERAAPDGTHYVSFATWMCPINCIEPDICPHTRGDRDWSMARALREYAASLSRDGLPGPRPYLFQCTHRAYGVGMIDVADVVAANVDLAVAGLEGASVQALVGTVSHCHGAVSLLSVGPKTDGS